MSQQLVTLSGRVSAAHFRRDAQSRGRFDILYSAAVRLGPYASLVEIVCLLVLAFCVLRGSAAAERRFERRLAA